MSDLRLESLQSFRRPGRGRIGLGEPLQLDDLPVLAWGPFRGACLDEVHNGAHLCALWVLEPNELFALFSRPRIGLEDRGLALLRTRVSGGEFPSMVAHLPQVQAFEREIAESGALRISGHPWLKPLRRHDRPHPFFQVAGAGIHEVAVGPVHAGVIEPGHFRFQCQGEEVLHLEIQLGYQHRGALPLFLKSTPARRLTMVETLAGDSTIAHAQAYCELLEGLAQTPLPRRAEMLRAIALELERLANHIGDLGAISGDIGYLPAASFLGRLRGEFLNLTLELCGSRFGRGLLIPGGVRFDLDRTRSRAMGVRLARATQECRATVEMLFDTPLVIDRLEGTGILAMNVAEELGVVGLAARASGVRRDVRHDHPRPTDRGHELLVEEKGDVMARAQLRWREAEQSMARVAEFLENLPDGPIAAPLGPLASDAIVASLTEGWRGEVAHVGLTDAQGELRDYRVVDPSFHNWFGLAMALRGNAISDFPLCNKSFNLSYCGHDL